MLTGGAAGAQTLSLRWREGEREGLGLFTGIYRGSEVTRWYLGGFWGMCVCFLGLWCFGFFLSLPRGN